MRRSWIRWIFLLRVWYSYSCDTCLRRGGCGAHLAPVAVRLHVLSPVKRRSAEVAGVAELLSSWRLGLPFAKAGPAPVGRESETAAEIKSALPARASRGREAPGTCRGPRRSSFRVYQNVWGRGAQLLGPPDTHGFYRVTTWMVFMVFTHVCKSLSSFQAVILGDAGQCAGEEV